MKSPESFSFIPEDDSENPESKTDNQSETKEELSETPEFNEERIDRERLRGAIDSALSGDSSFGLPTTIEELQERAAELKERFKDSENSSPVNPDGLREAYRKSEETLRNNPDIGSGSKEVTEDELRERARKLLEAERRSDNNSGGQGASA